MLWYLIFPLILIFYITQYYRRDSTGIIVLIFLLFFSVFRDISVGTDTVNYIDSIESVVKVFISKGSFFEDNGRYEYIYYLLCIAIYTFDLSPRFIITFFSVITFIFLYLGCKKNKGNTALVCLFYVLSGMYYLSFNIARQFTALSIFFYALSFIKEKGLKQYLFFLWLIIGVLIHKSVILCAPFFLCKFLTFNRAKIGRKVFLIYALSVIFPITSVFIKLLSVLNFSLFENYGADAVGGAYEQPLYGILYKLVIGYLLFNIYKLRSNNHKTDLYDNYFLLYMLMTALMAEGNLYFFRLKFNFLIVLCLYLSDFFKIMNKNKEPLYWAYCLLTYCYSIRTSMGYAPYSLSFDQIF